MVYREGKLLAAIAIPIGLVIGNVIGYFLIPAGWYWLTTLCVTVGVGLFAFIIVMIAIHTPVKELRQYLRWKHCDIPIIRENERKFRAAP